MEYILYTAAFALLAFWLLQKHKSKSSIYRMVQPKNLPPEKWIENLNASIRRGEVLVAKKEYLENTKEKLDGFTRNIFEIYGEIFVPQGDLKIDLNYHQGTIKNHENCLVIGVSEPDGFYIALKDGGPVVVSIPFIELGNSTFDAYENVVALILDYAEEI